MTAEGRASCQDHHWKTCPAWQCWLCMISSSMTTSAPGRGDCMCASACIVRVAYGVAPGAACTLLAQLMHDWIRFTWRGLCTIPIPSGLESRSPLASKPAQELRLHSKAGPPRPLRSLWATWPARGAAQMSKPPIVCDNGTGVRLRPRTWSRLRACAPEPMTHRTLAPPRQAGSQP